MLWDVYADSTSISTGVDVHFVHYTIDGIIIQPKVGDDILIDYADGNKGKGSITQVTSNELQVQVDGQSTNWKFIESKTTSSNGQIKTTYHIIS